MPTMVLRARRGDDALGEWAGGGEPITIGAWEGATLRLPDAPAPVVAVIDGAGGDWRLVALVDACLVNGERVRRAQLRAGDRVRIGDHELVVEGSGRPHVAEAPLALKATLRWGQSALETRVVRPGELVTAGPRGATFELPEDVTGGRTWPLVAWAEGAWRVALDGPLRARSHAGPLLSTDLDGAVPRLGRRLAVPRQWVPLPADGRAEFEAGALTIELAPCPPSELGHVDRTPAWRTEEGLRVVIALLVSLTLFAIILNPPPAPFRPDEQHFRVQQLAARIRPPPPPADDPERVKRWKRLAEERAEESAAKAKLAEGKAGRPDRDTNGRRAGPKTDAEIVKEHELLKALASGATTKLLSGGALAEASQVGALDGPAIGDAAGTLGLGVRGSGPGGGGVGTESVGVGPVGTKGLGRAAAGAGKIGGGGQSELGLDEPADVDGGLDREVIRRVVLAHRAQIRFCYEKALQTQPQLAGKVAVEFVIGADGKVTTARAAEDSVGAEVGACVVSKVRGWSFPKPKGGGVVVVTYPFLFKQAGGGK